jgi:hypothetical protein
MEVTLWSGRHGHIDLKRSRQTWPPCLVPGRSSHLGPPNRPSVPSQSPRLVVRGASSPVARDKNLADWGLKGIEHGGTCIGGGHGTLLEACCCNGGEQPAAFPCPVYSLPLPHGGVPDGGPGQSSLGLPSNSLYKCHCQDLASLPSSRLQHSSSSAGPWHETPSSPSDFDSRPPLNPIFSGIADKSSCPTQAKFDIRPA